LNKKTENSKECSKEKIAFVNVIEESEATGKVKEVYEDIQKTLGIDFVPNMYKAMANNPDYLDITWKKIQSVMTKQGKLDSKTKDIIALTVSIMSGSDYCIGVYNEAVKHNGLDDEALTELYSIIDTYIGLNRLNIAWGVKADKKPWYGCAG
jgi:AhpD family alkylhydroperoxidase